MYKLSRLTLILSLCLFLFIIPALAQRRAQRAAARTAATVGSAQSYRKARQALDAAIDALGGLDAIRAAEDVTVKVQGYSYARNQSVRVQPPYDAETRDEMLFLDVRNRRYIVETRDPLPGGFVFGGKSVITGGQGFFVNPRDKTIAPLNLTTFNNIGLIRRVPHLFLMAAYETAPSTLRWLGEEMYDGRKHNVITFASGNGIQWTLYLDARTNLLTKYDQMVSDNLVGDTVQETIFPGYRTVGRLRVPTARMTKRAGEVIEDVRYVDVQFNTHPPESAFAKPTGLEELPAPTPPPTKETKLAEGVYLFESGANTLVVEFNDYVLVFEPYAGGRGAKPTITKIKELIPGKPIKYVVVSHHHDDHSGGLRSYIAEGAAVVTTSANQRYFEKMASGTFTISADDQTRSPRQPIFEFVQNKKHVFTDGKQTVEIIDIGPSPHAEEMLIGYLPKERLVFQGDLVNLPANGKYMPTTIIETTTHFVEAISRLGLDVKRIAAVHGPMTTMEDLREAMEKKRASK
ncbi:MAG TPA: MBL fold metallo-hydrolase [Pyrinomonadaceae bacterium]